MEPILQLNWVDLSSLDIMSNQMRFPTPRIDPVAPAKRPRKVLVNRDNRIFQPQDHWNDDNIAQSRIYPPLMVPNGD